MVNGGQQRLARLLREVEHHIAQKDDVEAIVRALEWGIRPAQVGLAEVAHPVDLGLDHPILANMVEEAHHMAHGQSAVDLDAVKEPLWARRITSMLTSVPSIRIFQSPSKGKCSLISMARLNAS